MSPTPPPNRWFRLVIVCGALFAFTALCMFATTLGRPDAPPNRFFSAYGMPIILVETVALIAVSIIAMAVDRRQTVAQRTTPPGMSRADLPSDGPRPAEPRP